MTLNERITAVHVLQRFVRLSRTLLPLYSELLNKNKLSISEEIKISRIKGVYDNFDADPKASVYLVNSEILSLIQSVYRRLNTKNEYTAQSLYEYDLFIQESDRLIETWNQQKLN